MLLHIPAVLDPDEVLAMREALARGGDAWVDGRVTAGHQGAPLKANQQLAEGSALARSLGERVLAALERHPLFISAALPLRVYPPMFNRYQGGGHFGTHVDNAVRLLPGQAERLRTDLSATLFLADPDSYDGGVLEIEDHYGTQQVKLPAGDLVLYPSTSLHQVTPVTRGVRLASFLWVQSMVRDDTRRTLLFDMDTAIQRLHQTGADADACRQLTGCYHNLLRQWADCH